MQPLPSHFFPRFSAFFNSLTGGLCYMIICQVACVNQEKKAPACPFPPLISEENTVVSKKGVQHAIEALASLQLDKAVIRIGDAEFQLSDSVNIYHLVEESKNQHIAYTSDQVLLHNQVSVSICAKFWQIQQEPPDSPQREALKREMNDMVNQYFHFLMQEKPVGAASPARFSSTGSKIPHSGQSLQQQVPQHMAGIICDAEEKPIKGIRIRTADGAVVTQSDKNGGFQLALPLDFSGEELRLYFDDPEDIFSAVNYDYPVPKTNIKVNLSKK